MKNVDILRAAAVVELFVLTHCVSAPQHAWITLTAGHEDQAPRHSSGIARSLPRKGNTCEAWIRPWREVWVYHSGRP